MKRYILLTLACILALILVAQLQWATIEYGRGYHANGSYILAVGEVLDNVITEDSSLFDPMWDTLEWAAAHIEP